MLNCGVDFSRSWFFTANAGLGVGDVSGGFWLRHSGSDGTHILPKGDAGIDGVLEIPGFFRNRRIEIKPSDIMVSGSGAITLYVGRYRLDIVLECGGNRATLTLKKGRFRSWCSVFRRA